MGQVLPLHSIPGDMFTWTRGHGVTEDSTLCANGYANFTNRFYVKSHKTGTLMLFCLLTEITDDEEEVQGWVYESAEGVQITILND